MAERRMFAKTIIDSDAFLDMPATAQLLYFHLSMRADDDGFINKPKAIMRLCGARDDDAKMLIEKKFVIPFESGVVVIKHWKIHNYIRNDRYKETNYKEEMAMLSLDENNSYTTRRRNGDDPDTDCQPSVNHLSTNGIPTVDKMDTQDRLGKDRLGKDSKDIDIGAATAAPPSPKRSKKFVKPTVEEVRSYCAERGNNVDPQQFIDHYESNGWKVGRNSMKDWKAAVRTWEKNEYGSSKNNSEPASEPRFMLGEYL